MAGALEGKVALITGGSAGIGKAAAKLFAEAGASVAFAARGVERGKRVEQELRRGGLDVRFVQADVSHAEQVQALIAEIVERFGRLDCAFNNAAVLGRNARTADFSDADFEVEVTSNLKSVWLCMKYELQQMQSQEPRGGDRKHLLDKRTWRRKRGCSVFDVQGRDFSFD
jgi:NAD(P)-dependent dehydrogenase (short-subunit alcohol dehydrogenase family)